MMQVEGEQLVSERIVMLFYLIKLLLELLLRLQRVLFIHLSHALFQPSQSLLLVLNSILRVAGHLVLHSAAVSSTLTGCSAYAILFHQFFLSLRHVGFALRNFV
jgi:hypothetical protein